MPLADLSAETEGAEDVSAEDASTVATTEAAEPAAAEEPRERVVLKPQARRGAKEAEREALAAKVKDLEAVVERTRTQTQAEIQQERTERARLQGILEAQAFQAQQTQQRGQQQTAPDPAELQRQARAALDAKDFAEYERLNRASIFAEMEQRGAFRQPTQQQQATAEHPMKQVLMNMHPDVALHPQGWSLAVAKDIELHALGMQPGPERFKKAFEMAQASIKGAGNAGQTYSQQGAGALGSAIPTNGAGGRGSAGESRRGPGVELSPLEKEWAKRADMDLEEYAKFLAESHPERIVR